MEQESCGRNHEGGVIKEEHGGGIMEEETWRSNPGGGNIQETWRRNHGEGIMQEESCRGGIMEVELLRENH